MNNQPARRSGLLWLLGCLSVLLVFGGGGYFFFQGTAPAAPAVEMPPEAAEASHADVRRVCAVCHAYPPPDTFPRFAWRREVRQAYDFLRNSSLQLEAPSFESVVAYYEKRAPEELPFVEPKNFDGEPPVRFRQSTFPAPSAVIQPAISNLNLVHLADEKKLDLLACDMRSGQIMVMKPYEASPSLRTLATVPFPAHVEVVDLDKDGVKDLLVANLGNFVPTDAKVGSVTWLKGAKEGTYNPITLLENVGRVADVQAADFRGTGQLDLVVAVFGWRDTGEILYLKNKTTDWSKPVFEASVLDHRHGAIHVCVTDLNGDGKPDIVALLSQEHEKVEAYLNEGDGTFTRKTIFEGPHPTYGSSGIQVVDLNGDGKPDVLLTNGDTLDEPYLVKPYHGVQWLENKGTFPFEYHHLTAMPGAMRAIAADFTGKGKLDVLAVSFLPPRRVLRGYRPGIDSIVLLEQTEPGNFVRHSLEKDNCNHVSCVAGDWDGDGRIHFATGFFTSGNIRVTNEVVSLWKKSS